VATKIAGLGKGHGNGRIDCVAATFEHVDPRFAGKSMSGNHHSVLGSDRRRRRRPAARGEKRQR
jgi:hypothetical protein